MKINTNNQVKLNLTQNGKDIYQEYLNQFSANPSISQIVPDELTITLWEFAQIFGPQMYMGNPKGQITIDNEIELIK